MAWKFYDANGSEIQGIGIGAVATANIADDAVTADKLANSINAEIAANTAKVTNATHTGDVTGATSLTLDKTAISGQSAKTTIVDADTILIGDSAASDALKKMTKANVTAGLGGVGLGMVIALGG